MNIPVRKYWSLLVDYLHDQRLRVSLLAILLLSTAGLQLIRPQILKIFVDAVGANIPMQALLNAGLLFMGIALLEQVVRVGSVYLSENIGWTATNALRLDLAAHSLQLDMAFHNRHTPGELIERIDGDVTALANFFSQFALQVMGNALLLIGMLLLLFREHWLVGIALAALAGLALLAINGVRILSVPYWLAGRQASADLAGFFEERLSGLEDIRANGATAYKLRLLYELMRTLYRRYRAARAIANVISNGVFFLQALALAIGIGLGAYLFERGELTIGSVFLISYYARLLAWPLHEIVSQVEDLQQAEASIERVKELVGTQPAIQDGPGAHIPGGPLSVEFQDVAFAYHAGGRALDGISFRLEAGRVIGLLGRTGSGKTTITRLLFRFYDPAAGSIYLQGVDIRKLHLADLRQRIGLVTQEVQLFHGTIRDNLTFFDRSISDEALLKAIEDLGLSGWFKSFPQGLDTILAAGGAGLSAGEAQLLAFTRVFLKDPGLVILDEASSRLDLATERLIERALDRLLQNRTGMIIAHRLGTVKRVDEVLILEDGRILEHGSRERLMSDPASRFSQLLRMGIDEVLA